MIVKSIVMDERNTTYKENQNKHKNMSSKRNTKAFFPRPTSYHKHLQFTPRRSP
jgi:hypothetical protein